MLVILSYGILLIASIADLHRIDICLDGHYLKNSADPSEESGGYLFNDENGCFTHQAYTSINQVVFYNSSFRGIPDPLFVLISNKNFSCYSARLISGSQLRAPPVIA